MPPKPRPRVESTPHIWEVVPGRIFLGDMTAALEMSYMSDRRITHVVSVCIEPVLASNPRNGLAHLRIPVPLGEVNDLLTHMPNAVGFIEKALTTGGVVLVHCDTGFNRAATIVVAYLMRIRRTHSADAINELRQICDWANPAPYYQRQLVAYEDCRYKIGPNEGIYLRFMQEHTRALQLLTQADQLARTYGHPNNVASSSGGQAQRRR